jgi:hypothetical protein
MGKLQRKRPTAVGQADYYGVIANTAARIMAKAAPGQVLIEGHLPFTKHDRSLCKIAHEMRVGLNTEDGCKGEATLTLKPLGRYQFKGLSFPLPIFEVRPSSRCYMHARLITEAEALLRIKAPRVCMLQLKDTGRMKIATQPAPEMLTKICFACAGQCFLVPRPVSENG